MLLPEWQPSNGNRRGRLCVACLPPPPPFWFPLLLPPPHFGKLDSVDTGRFKLLHVREGENCPHPIPSTTQCLFRNLMRRQTVSRHSDPCIFAHNDGRGDIYNQFPPALGGWKYSSLDCDWEVSVSLTIELVQDTV